jgi:hypothetical protein
MARPHFVAVVCALVLLSPLIACESKGRRASGYYTQAQAGRGAAAASMAADWRAKKLSLDDCIDLAFAHLDAEGDNASLVFAGTVLDFAQLIEKELPKAGEMELFWTRVGGLAAASGEKAYRAQDVKMARSLVLAGPTRWQTEAYWMRHPNHDALASYVLFYSGEGAEAVRRLRTRTDLEESQRQALEDIQRMMREAPQ